MSSPVPFSILDLHRMEFNPNAWDGVDSPTPNRRRSTITNTSPSKRSRDASLEKSEKPKLLRDDSPPKKASARDTSPSKDSVHPLRRFGNQSIESPARPPSSSPDKNKQYVTFAARDGPPTSDPTKIFGASQRSRRSVRFSTPVPPVPPLQPGPSASDDDDGDEDEDEDEDADAIRHAPKQQQHPRRPEQQWDWRSPPPRPKKPKRRGQPARRFHLLAGADAHAVAGADLVAAVQDLLRIDGFLFPARRPLFARQEDVWVALGAVVRDRRQPVAGGGGGGSGAAGVRYVAAATPDGVVGRLRALFGFLSVIAGALEEPGRAAARDAGGGRTRTQTLFAVLERAFANMAGLFPEWGLHVSVRSMGRIVATYATARARFLDRIAAALPPSVRVEHCPEGKEVADLCRFAEDWVVFMEKRNMVLQSLGSTEEREEEGASLNDGEELVSSWMEAMEQDDVWME